MLGVVKVFHFNNPFASFFQNIGGVFEKKYFPDAIIHRADSLSWSAPLIAAKLLIWFATKRQKKREIPRQFTSIYKGVTMKKISLSMAAFFAVLALLTASSVMAQDTAVAPTAASQQVITTDDAPAPTVVLAQTAAPVQTAVPAQTVAPVQTAAPARTIQPTAPRQLYPYSYGYAYPQQYQHQHYNNRSGRPVTFQEYFGFDGIPFNGSHIQAFRRYHGRGF